MVIRIDKRKFKYVLVVLAALLLSFMFHLDSSMNMDFNRYQQIMESIRFSNLSYLDFMGDKSNQLRWLNAILPYMYSFNTLLFVVSKAFTNNYVIVWLSALIDYSIVSYIAYDYKKESRYTRNEIVVAFLICFAYLPLIHVCSGLRTATSACIMALAIYRFLYRNGSPIGFVVLSVLSITFHPFTLFAVPIAVVIRLTSKKIVFYIVAIGCLFLSRVAILLSTSGNVLLKALGTKYITYTAEDQFRAYRFAMYGVLIFSAITIFYYLVIYRRGKNSSRKVIGEYSNIDSYQRLFLFYISYMALIVGSMDSYEMVCRGGYFIGASAPIIASLIFGDMFEENRTAIIMIRMAIILLLIYMCINWIRYYYPYFIL